MNYTPELGKLAGMAYHGGLTPEHWQEITGIDPRKVPGIEISRSGLCYWTKRAETQCRAHWNARQSDMRMLTSA